MQPNTGADNHNYFFLKGGGEMGELIRSFDWLNHPLGSPLNWPQSLKITLSILLNSRFPMFLFWGEELFCFYNDAYRPSLGINGKHPRILASTGAAAWEEIWPFIEPLIKQVLGGGEATWHEDQLLPIYRNGGMEDVYWTFSYSPVSHENGSIAGVFVTCAETTGKFIAARELELANKQLETALDAERHAQRQIMKSEERFRKLIMQAPVSICILRGRELIFETANNIALTALGKTDDIIGKPLLEVFPELNGQPFQQLLQNVFNTGEPYLGDETRVTFMRDGQLTEGYFNFIYQPVTDDLGHTAAIMVLATDVTKEVNARQKIHKLNAELVESESRARLAIDAAEMGTYDLNLQTNVVITSQRLDEIMGVSHQTDHAKYFSVLHTDDIPVRNAAFEEAVKSGKLQYQARIMRQGQIRWIQANGRLYLDENGRPLRVLGIMIDITNHVNAYNATLKGNEALAAANEELAATNEEIAATNEELTEAQDFLRDLNSRLTESEYRFRSLIEQAPVAICIFSGRDLVIEAANERMQTVLGKSEAIIGQRLAHAIPELEGQPFLGLLEGVFNTGEVYEGVEAKAVLEKNGQLTDGYFNFIFQPIKDSADTTTAIIVVATDVTEQLNARRELEQAYEQVRLSKEAAQLGTFDMDMINGTMEWDTRCRLLFGINHTGDVTYEKDFLTGLHPDDRQRIIGIIDNVFIKSKTNGVYDVEYRTVGAEDQKLRWVRAKGQAYFDNDERPVRFIGSVLDITEQKQDELRKNDFIGMVSHELKTPLTSLTAIIQVLNARFKAGEDTFIANSLNRANVQVKKMSAMINGFLNISRLESGKMQMDKTAFNIEELVSSVIADTQLISPGHHIVLLPCDNIRISADRDKISSVVSNLLSNAVKYSTKGSSVTVDCAKQGAFVKVSITDEGIGIAEQDLKPLFDRYYRVDNPNYKHISGFGIGLYLSSEIVKSHGGQIGVESSLGEGSTFYFLLPVAY